MWQPGFLFHVLLDCIIMVTILDLGLCANFKVIYQLEMSHRCKFQPFTSCTLSVLIFHFTSAITWKAALYVISWAEKFWDRACLQKEHLYHFCWILCISFVYVKFYVSYLYVYGIYLGYLHFTFIFIIVSLYSFT